MAEPYGRGAEFGAAEFGAAEFGQTGGAAQTTTITPSAGSLSLAGQLARTDRLTPLVSALSVAGQQPVQRIGVVPGTGALGLTGQATPVGAQAGLVSNEYTGDGASSRSFSSAGFAPLAVIVIGKDGSGNVVGAIKTPDMPAGKSQPLLQNASAADAGRSDRITSLDVNGFTVGPDLNVTGRKYAYVMFPAGRASTVNAGTFLGPGGKSDVNSSLVTSGSSLSGTAIFTATGDEASGWKRPAGSTVYSDGAPLVTAGRRIIRNSDGAVICEVTSSINADSATGVVYLTGTFGGTTWHWEEYYADVPGFGGCPDMLLYFADDTAAAAQPLTVVAPNFMAATTGSWQGTGAGALFAFFNSASDPRLHVLPGAGHLTKGVRFRWLAFRADEAATGVRMALFQYTSDGNARSITGLDFAPEWMFSFGSSSDFRWAKKTNNIVGASRVRSWQDGTGDAANYDYTFNADGFSVPAGPGENLNNSGSGYTILLFVASPVTAAPTPSTGSLALAGQTPAFRSAVSVRPNTAELHLVGRQPTVTPNFTRVTPGTGSLILTPRNPLCAVKRTITPKAAALALSGKAVKTKETHTPGPPPHAFHEQGDTGELQVVGRQPVLKRGVMPGAGALGLSGQKPFVKPPDFPAFTSAGSLALVGQQPKQVVTVTPRAGALAATGEAAILNQSFPKRLTVNTGALGLSGQRPPLAAALTPEAGLLQAQAFNTEPVVESNNTSITPSSGVLTASGVSPSSQPDVRVAFTRKPLAGALDLQGREPVALSGSVVTPDSGALVLEGQDAVVQEVGQTTVTPGAGALAVVGYGPTAPLVTFITPGTGSMGGGTCVCNFPITPNTGALVIAGYPPVVHSTQPPAPPLHARFQGGGASFRKTDMWPKRRTAATVEVAGSPAGVASRAEAAESDLALLDVLDT